jgi:uncharacterized protein with PQ loop repeat
MKITKENYSSYECFGSMAALLGIISTFPQVYKTIKTKDTSSFSLISLLLGFTVSICWFLHSYFMTSFSGVFSSIYSLLYSSFLLYAKVFFKSR